MPQGATFNATFSLKLFKLCLIDDSRVEALKETGDPFQDFELSEIIVDIRDLYLSFDSYDQDNIKHLNSTEIKATLGDLGLIYVEKFEQKSFKKLVTLEHKILWKQHGEHALTDLSLLIANQRIKGLKEDKSDFVDQDLNVEMRAIYFEYRKEYIEFFMTFFQSDDDVKDEVKLRAIEEYERLKEATNIKNMLE